MTKEYEEYLLSPEWKAFRKKAFAHYGRKCDKCHRTKRLQIHHKTYKNIFHELLEDVVVLCVKHHEEVHGINMPVQVKVKKKKKSGKKRKGNSFIPNQNRKGHIKRNKAIKKASKPKNFYPALDALIEKKRAREARRMRVVE